MKSYELDDEGDLIPMSAEAAEELSRQGPEVVNKGEYSEIELSSQPVHIPFDKGEREVRTVADGIWIERKG